MSCMHQRYLILPVFFTDERCHLSHAQVHNAMWLASIPHPSDDCFTSCATVMRGSTLSGMKATTSVADNPAHWDPRAADVKIQCKSVYSACAGCRLVLLIDNDISVAQLQAIVLDAFSSLKPQLLKVHLLMHALHHCCAMCTRILDKHMSMCHCSDACWHVQ